MTDESRYGILSPGIHEMSMEEIGRVFGGDSKSPHRLRLFENLKNFVDLLQSAKIGNFLILDGSFIMACVEMPKDIDIILVMPRKWDRTVEEILPKHYNLLSSRIVKEQFGFDLFVVAENSPEYHGWIRFFSNIKGDWHFAFSIPEGVLKGLVRVNL